jgi:hypothetical protein
MKRLFMFPFGVGAVGLFTLWVLAQDLRLWWAWRKEDKAAGVVPHARAALGDRCAGDAAAL